MYGTLSFNRKRAKQSTTQLRAFSSVVGKVQRKPACDECRAARVKCLEKSKEDKCARCYDTNRDCTYNSTRRRSQASELIVNLAPRAATDTGNSVEDESGGISGNSSATSSLPSAPLPQTNHSTWIENQGDLDMAIELTLSKPIGVTSDDNNQLQDFDFSSLDHDYQSDIFNPASTLLTTPVLTSDIPAPAKHAELPVTPSNPQAYANTNTGASAAFSELIDRMPLVQDHPSSCSGSATSTPPSCGCTQELTCTLFNLRKHTQEAQIDRLLVLFKQTTCKWNAVEKCPLGCLFSQSTLLLMLMNVQELVALHLDANSSINTTKNLSQQQSSSIAINIGVFIVEDGADRRFITNSLLTARTKELYSLLARLSSKIKLAGFNDVSQEYDHQLRLLKGSFDA